METKKKYLKILSVILINILFLIIAFFLIEFFIFLKYSQPEQREAFGQEQKAQFKYYLRNITPLYTELADYFNGEDNQFCGRLPVGTDYNSTPILIFGDSFAHGQYLNPDQNFGYKLSQALKRPVYNRAVSGSGPQTMYYQVSEPFADTFFSQVPQTDTVFYILIGQHYERMVIFSVFDPIGDSNFFLKYKIVNGKLKIDNYNNPFLNFLKSSYIIHVLNLKYVEKYIHSKLFSNKVADDFLVYFNETRNALENKWNNKIKFNVILYDDVPLYCGIPFKNVIKQKLLDNGYNVIDISELTNEDLNSPEYLMQDNNHPTEKAWDLLTPLIIDKSLL